MNFEDFKKEVRSTPGRVIYDSCGFNYLRNQTPPGHDPFAPKTYDNSDMGKVDLDLKKEDKPVTIHIPRDGVYSRRPLVHQLPNAASALVDRWGDPAYDRADYDRGELEWEPAVRYEPQIEPTNEPLNRVGAIQTILGNGRESRVEALIVDNYPQTRFIPSGGAGRPEMFIPMRIIKKEDVVIEGPKMGARIAIVVNEHNRPEYKQFMDGHLGGVGE